MTTPSSSDRALHILHVDDDEDDFILMRDLLADISHYSISVDWASTYHDALEQLNNSIYDLCLLDYYLGEYTGLDVLRQAQDDGCTVPFIMLTGTGNRAIDLEAMESGADYYIEKNEANAFDLERAIRYALERARLLRSLRDLNTHLEERVVERTALLRQAKDQLEAEIAENERMEVEIRELRQERTRLALQQISQHPRTTVTASLLGVRPLRETEPNAFAQLVHNYGELLDLALEQFAYRVDYHLSDQLRTFAEFMGELRLSPRDIVEIHNAVIKEKSEGAQPAKIENYIEEGRLMILELMGYLAAYYRNFAASSGIRGGMLGNLTPPSQPPQP